MLVKLSLRNAKRQAKDYIIYFITIIISVSLMFSFNSISNSEDVCELSSYMSEFSTSITVISIVIILIMAWLINYTMKFMLEKRSKEFGIYQILGIEKKSISNMFTLENIIIGGLAFLIGILVGTFLYQIFTSIIMNLFNQTYEVKIVFSLKAVLITAMYFFGIFILVLLNCKRKIRKTKVYDLFYANKKNENNIIKKAKGSVFIFLISLILLIVALLINNKQFTDTNNMSAKNVAISIIMLIIGIYLFYISISSFIVKRYLENKKRKYKKDNMFLYRNLTSKINTMSITIGTIAVMFTIILIGGNVALLFNNLLNNEIQMGYPFEIMMSNKDDDFSKYKNYIEKNSKVKNMYQYKLYYIKTTEISQALKNTPFEGKYTNDLETIMKLSDYNKLREILGYEKVELQDDEIIVNCLKTAESIFKKYVEKHNKVEMLGKVLKIKEVKSENLSQMGFNGYYYTIVVKDDIINPINNNSNDNALKIGQKNTDENVEIYHYDFSDKLVCVTEEMTNEKFYKELRSLIPKKQETMIGQFNGEMEEYKMEIPSGSIQTKGERTSETKSFFTIISFLAFYIALIFVMSTATLLAIQQLSDSEKYKYRYDLLKKLGVEESKINKIIFKQLLFYFAIPMIMPIIVTIPAVLSVSSVFTVVVSTKEVFQNILIVLVLFILVYGIYFIATNVQFDRNINGDR